MVVTTVERSRQARESLARANEVRMARAAYTDSLKALTAPQAVEAVRVLLTGRLPDWAARMPAGGLLGAIHRVGPKRVRRFLAPEDMNEAKMLGEMTPRQRSAICERLGELASWS